MTGPAVNIVLRLDQSKIKEDAGDAEKKLKAALSSVAGSFVLAGAAAKALGEGARFAFDALQSVASHTGGFQQFEKALTASNDALGRAADRSGALRSAFKVGEQAAQEFTRFLDSPAGRGAVNAFFGGIVSLGADSIDTVLGLYKASVDVFRFLEQKVNYIRNGVSVESLDQSGDYGAFVDRAEKFANDLRNASKRGVESSGTYVDEKAVAAAKKDADDLEKNIAAALARAQAAAAGQLKAANAALDQRRAAAEAEAKIEQNLTDLLAENAARREDIAFDLLAIEIHKDKELAESARKFDVRAAQEVKATKLKWDTITNTTAAGVESLASATALAIAGQGDFGELFASMFGNAIAAQGALLIAEGGFALAQNGLATFFPAVAAALGVVPGLGVPAALGAIATGTLMLGGGAYLSSLASGGGGGGVARGGGGGSTPAGGRASAAARTPQGFQDGGDAGGGNITNVTNYNLNGPIGGSPRRIARGLADARRGTTAPGAGGR